MGAGDSNGIGVKVGIEAMLGQLSTSVDSLGQMFSKIHQVMTQNPRQSPLVRPLQGYVVSDGSTYVFIDLGGPAAGRIWDIRRLAVWKGGGVDMFATVSGVNVVAVTLTGGALPQRGIALANLPPILDLAFGPGQVPNDGEFSAHEFTIRFQQKVVLILKGTSNNDNYSATGQAEEYLESSYELVVA